MAAAIMEPLSKKGRYELGDSEDSTFYDSDESTHSWQGYETAWVKDSGDDWSPSSTDSDDDRNQNSDDDRSPAFIANVYQVEYEVATDSSDSHPELTDSEGSSTDVEQVILPVIAAAACEIDDECWAESESSDDAIIAASPPPKPPSPHQLDQWKCLRCGVLNYPPMRYCHRCYEIRKGWLPDRPKGRRRKRQAKKKRADDLMYETPSTSTSSQTTDSGIDSQSSVCGSRSAVCELCGIRQINGLFLHGKTGHQMYCYYCSKNVWRTQNHCPICRRTIQNVVKVFTSFA